MGGGDKKGSHDAQIMTSRNLSVRTRLHQI